ncbi:DUF2065 domain-containing protein [Lysobacter sp. cf310]|uniref:DUF2065 domain-containing protein n=1 Tax=Lysobacter sp. cf310 TaxID=1761790 RepID=UPI0008E10746|nr:DUF2065 family protein [Lysobacter sp. cf310]SFK79941.1 hypothetical protein SAMN04487938_2070 [Lysobacter sp. cf310]
MSGELISALCLVAVLEGLFLFVAPRGWKRAAEQLQAMPDRQLRIVGAVAAAVGVLALWAVRA